MGGRIKGKGERKNIGKNTFTKREGHAYTEAIINEQQKLSTVSVFWCVFAVRCVLYMVPWFPENVPVSYRWAMGNRAEMETD